ncbi:MAG TPA: DUF2158 domain-containing protein [Stellaceae bacterium]|jgi:uncharacterized protein YodC (DUF2158 family)
MAFKVGDVVQLASGGIPMTVTHVDGTNIECHWSEGNKQRSKVFQSATLVQHHKELTLEQLVLASMNENLVAD